MRYEAPDSLEGAVALLAGAKGETRVLAGGTDLLVQMRADILDPDLIVDIKKIPETRAITEEKGGWRIGAAVTGAELKEHPRLCEGKVPVKIWLCAPDGKRLEATTNWPAFKTNTYPKLKSTLAKKYPGFTWI